MAYAASLLAAVAILLIALHVVFVAIAREVPEDRESEIEVKFGPAKIRRRIGAEPANAAVEEPGQDG